MTSASDRQPSTPPAAGVRARWENVPERVRALVERRLGSRVVDARSQPGGFSPGLASVLTTADGRSVFVKAAGPELNPDTPGYHRREAAVAALLPQNAPVSRLLWSHDEGPDGWIVLAFEVIDGRSPRIPWQADELDLVMEGLIRLSAELTPSPLSPDIVGRTDEGWEILKTNEWEQLAAYAPERLDPWSRRHLDRLVALHEQLPAAVRGETLLHVDLRADNILIAGDRVVIVDWPYACVGAAWIDLAAMAPSVAMQGGPDPDTLLMRHPAARSADPEAITTVIAAFAGFFLARAARPDPPGLPTLRAFQQAQGEVSREWLARRTGWH